MHFRRLGVDLIRFDRKAGGTERPPVADMTTILEDLKARGLECSSIMDVGANCGNWSRIAAKVFPLAKFILIEPLAELQKQLESFCEEHPGSRLVLAGAGSKSGELPLKVMPNISASSLILNEEFEQARGELRPTQIVTIDSLISSGVPIPALVKLDIQGYELEALKGASLLFGTTDVFILEVSFFPFRSPKRVILHDVVRFMLERDYVCYDFAGFLRRPLDGALAQADVVFVKRDGFLRSSSRWE